ncbi:hypothetical protein TNCV_1444411 [Trichonephila clavipes]|nr:hypothetical protein TNCV_1444411 [Trichonephila clavipes]
MEGFTNTELADIYLNTGLAKGNARAAETSYREKFPLTDTSNLNQKLSEHGLLQVDRHSGCSPRVSRTIMALNMLDTVQKNPSISVQATVGAVGLSQSRVHSFLQREGSPPYRFQRVAPQHM